MSTEGRRRPSRSNHPGSAVAPVWASTAGQVKPHHPQEAGQKEGRLAAPSCATRRSPRGTPRSSWRARPEGDQPAGPVPERGGSCDARPASRQQHILTSSVQHGHVRGDSEKGPPKSGVTHPRWAHAGHCTAGGGGVQSASAAGRVGRGGPHSVVTAASSTL